MGLYVWTFVSSGPDGKENDLCRGQTDRGYKKPDMNTDIRTQKFVSDNRNRIIEIPIRLGIKQLADIGIFQKNPESEK